jgi:alpha-tubulin suppressor-like RCC1 family protein
VQGKTHFLARTGSGAVYSFGKNDRGQLGHGHCRPIIQPTLISKFAAVRETVVQIAAGDHHSVALTSLGSVYTWGRAEDGEAGNGSAIQLTPRYVAKLQTCNITSIVAGSQFVGALDDKGHVYVWGNGIGRMVAFPTLVPFEHDTKVIAIAAGFSHMLALTESKQVYSWGVGTLGQLGHGPGKLNVTIHVPQLIAELATVRVRSIACGPFYSVVIDGIYTAILSSVSAIACLLLSSSSL